MTLREQIHGWMKGREDEFCAALAPLISVDSTTGTPAPGMPFGAGPDEALRKTLALAESWGLQTRQGFLSNHFTRSHGLQRALRRALLHDRGRRAAERTCRAGRVAA